MGVRQAIRDADACLPGEAAEEGPDPRWQAIIAVGTYVESDPEAVWGFVPRWGGHPDEDLRRAIATCLLEHLLEDHFARFVPRVERLALAEPLFGDTFLRSWQFGQAEEPTSAATFDTLRRRLLGRNAGNPGAAADRPRD